MPPPATPQRPWEDARDEERVVAVLPIRFEEVRELAELLRLPQQIGEVEEAEPAALEHREQLSGIEKAVQELAQVVHDAGVGAAPPYIEHLDDEEIEQGAGGDVRDLADVVVEDADQLVHATDEAGSRHIRAVVLGDDVLQLADCGLDHRCSPAVLPGDASLLQAWRLRITKVSVAKRAATIGGMSRGGGGSGLSDGAGAAAGRAVSPGDGNIFALLFAQVDLARPGDLLLLVLDHLQPLGDPTGRAGDGEEHRE